MTPPTGSGRRPFAGAAVTLGAAAPSLTAFPLKGQLANDAVIRAALVSAFVPNASGHSYFPISVREVGWKHGLTNPYKAEIESG